MDYADPTKDFPEFPDDDVANTLLYLFQNGKCAVSGLSLDSCVYFMHRRKPVILGGRDFPYNIILIHVPIQQMIYTSNMNEFHELLREMQLNEKQLSWVMQLRDEFRGAPLKKLE